MTVHQGGGGRGNCGKMTQEGRLLSLRTRLGVDLFVSTHRQGALKGEEEGWAEGERMGGFGELPGCGLSIRSGGLGARGAEKGCANT